MQTKYILTLAALFASVPTAFAQLTIPSDGSDGAFNPAANIEIDLSQAVTGTWNANNTANAGLGIYDRDKWAVVFKYSSVNIPPGVTVTFKNHISHAPVVWLVSGNVTIAGTVSVNGRDGNNLVSDLTEPGPGGFRGGAYSALGFGTGLGIGGSERETDQAKYASVYGNPSIIPLIGGSGAGASSAGGTGGGGGGAILIAAPNSINLSSGRITAWGGNGGFRSANGSGGAIRLIANSIVGSGNLRANLSGDTSYPLCDGRIRLEANSCSGNIIAIPQVVPVPPAPAPVIWPASNAPTVSIASVAAVAAPAYPNAVLEYPAEDVSIAVNAATQVILQTQNFPINGTVQVRSAGKFTPNAVWSTATFTSGDAAQATWTANVNFPIGFTTLQARATIP